MGSAVIVSVTSIICGPQQRLRGEVDCKKAVGEKTDVPWWPPAGNMGAS